MKAAALLLTFVALASAQEKLAELKLRDGSVLKEVTIIRAELKGLRCEHKDGAGLIKKENLPADVAARYAEHFELEEKVIKEKEAAAKDAAEVKAAMAAAAAAEKGTEIINTAIYEGAGFFRYHLSIRELAGKEGRGVLSLMPASQWKPNGFGTRKVNLDLAAGGAEQITIDFHTGPVCRHGKEAGVRRFDWAFKTEDGRRYSGSIHILDAIAGGLEPDDDYR